MIFTVVWLPAALNQLASLWNIASARQAVTDASKHIDRLLRVDADKKGQPFFGGRLLIQSPLAVTFSVSLDDCLVEVIQVRRITLLQP